MNTIINNSKNEYNVRGERMSYIFYYPKGNYIFNRSVDLTSQPYKKYMKILKELGDNTLQSKYKEIADRQMSMDFMAFELLEVIPVENQNNRDQALLNERKQYWCENKHAIWNVNDKTIDIKADNIIQRNVMVTLDEIISELARAFYPFIKAEFINDIDDRIKKYFKQRSEVRRYKNIENYTADINKMNKTYSDLIDQSEDISTEINKLKIEKQLLKDEINKLHTDNPYLPEKYISNRLPDIPNKYLYLTSKQTYCVIAALCRGYGCSYSYVKDWMEFVRVRDDSTYTSDSNIKMFCDNTNKFSINSIKQGCNIINEFMKKGYIDEL